MPPRLDAASTLAFQTPLQEHPPAADGKAGALLTFIGLMFSLLAGQSDHMSTMLSTPSGERWITLAGLFGFGITALGTVVESFRTISPRFPPAPPSLAFFGDIAALSREEYVRKIESLEPEEALEQILRYNHTLAQICVAKFAKLRHAIRFFRYSVACWMTVMLLISMQVVL